jgi:diguanylate cyclase (GGDEF)-like protein
MKVFNPKDFHILLVNSTKDNERLAPAIATLEEAGYGMSFATGAEKTLESIKKFFPDLILLNLTEPNANSLQIGINLHDDSEYFLIPKIFLMANCEQEKPIAAIDGGTVDCLCEPFNKMELLTCIKTHLKLKRNRDELQKAYTELEKLVNTDPLTGVANRRALMAFGAREFNRAQRYNRPFSILTLDIDGFKQVNDNYGHDIGDRILILTTQIVTQFLRKADCFGRFGGEEFLAFLPETAQPQAFQVAERIRSTIAKTPHKMEEKKIFITISIGIATYQSDDQTLDVMLKRADLALYQAKEQGRNLTIVSTPVERS